MKFYIHKLGCPKNEVDADYIAARLITDGHEAVADPEEAESILVNTCGFILPAKEESIHELLRFGLLKQSGGLKTLYATGCLSQRHGDELLRDMPELDGAFGIGELDAIARAVTGQESSTRAVRQDAGRISYLDWNSRHVNDDVPYAYLKISDGCDRRCGYCAIPQIRGDYRSRPLDSVLAEAEFLVGAGKKELILVSQDATLYGSTASDPGLSKIVTLLRELNGIEGIRWIRLLYLHPAGLSDELVEYIASGNKTLPYFDLPLQHINNDLLMAMNRRVDRARIKGLISKIKNSVPGAAIRTTFIVGLPGENEARFGELMQFVEDTGFDRMGVFCYSHEEGTAAAQMPDQVPMEVRYRRLDDLMSLQQEIAFEKNNSLIGETLNVIIDAIFDGGTACGRTAADCPDIDQEVLVTGKDLSVGDIRPVTITAARGYDLEGTIVEG